MAQTKKEIVREKILETARNEFIRVGFKDASIRNIAAVAGVSKSNMYTYFKSKDELFSEVVKPTVNRVAYLLKLMETPENFSKETYGFGYHIEMISYLADFIRENRHNLKLLFFKAHGSVYERYVNDMIGKYTALTIKAIPIFGRKMGFENKDVSKFFVHSMVSSNINFIKEILMHELSHADIIRYGRELMTYNYFGQQALYGWSDEYNK